MSNPSKRISIVTGAGIGIGAAAARALAAAGDHVIVTDILGACRKFPGLTVN